MQLIINNRTSDVNGNIINSDAFGGFYAWFYLDIKIDNNSYNCDNFYKNSNFHRYVIQDNNPIYAGYQDLFWTNPYTIVNLLTLNLDPSRTGIIINFTFGIFDGRFHYQNTYVSNYLYNFHKTYSDTKNNGTKLVINANGGWGSNTANWEFQYYKF